MKTNEILRKLSLPALFLLAQPVMAHNLWLLPSSTVLAKAETITVDAAVSNDLFYFNHMPLMLNQLQVTAPDGQKLAIENPHRGRLRSSFDLSLKQSGSYQIAIVNHGVQASYQVQGEKKRWRGPAENLSKALPADATDVQITENLGRIETWVTLGKPTWLPASKQGLELKPAADLAHPDDLVAGEPARFALQLDGQPAAKIKITVIRGGTRYRNHPEELQLVTDARGEFELDLSQAGMYWLEATTADGKVSVPQARERRLTYALTFEVLPQ